MSSEPRPKQAPPTAHIVLTPEEKEAGIWLADLRGVSQSQLFRTMRPEEVVREAARLRAELASEMATEPKGNAA